MTSYQRVITTINNGMADRVPVIPALTYSSIKILKKNYIYNDIKDNPEIKAFLLAECFEKFDHDGIYSTWEASFNLMAEALGCKMTSKQDDVPSVQEPLIRTYKDIKKIKTINPEQNFKLKQILRMTEILRSRYEDRATLACWVPAPFTLSSLLVGIENFMRYLIRDKKFVKELNKLTMRASQKFIISAIRAGLDIVVISDPNATGGIISPKTFDDFAKPGIIELIKTVKSEGKIASLHICGNTNDRLENMAATGAACLEVDTPVDLRRAAKLVGKKVSLQGNIDTTTFLIGRPKDIFRAANKCFEDIQMGKGSLSGFILSSGCEIPYRAKAENIKALVAAAKQYKKERRLYGQI